MMIRTLKCRKFLSKAEKHCGQLKKMLTGELSQFIIRQRQKTFSIKVNHCQSVCRLLGIMEKERG